MEDLPRGVVSEARKGVEAFRAVVRAYEDAVAKHGLLVPPTTIAESLGVSPQRVDQLMDVGRLDAVTIAGRRWVVANSVERYLAEGPRKGGRPRKVGAVKQQLNHAEALCEAAEKLMD